MSYLSTSENVGFSGIPQNISDASCATQYKMAVEGVSPGGCGEVNMFIHDNSGDEQAYITHLNDNFYTKFKIDPNDLYSFHDSDVIAAEITVSHTEDHFMFPESVNVKSKLLESPSKELDLIGAFTNGDIKKEIKTEVVSNGHLSMVAKSPTNHREVKTTHTKAPKSKVQNQVKETARAETFSEVRRLSVHSPKAQSTATASSPSTKNSINSVNTNSAKSVAKQSAMETFLDVFKREQGLVENSSIVIKTEPQTAAPAKIPVSPPKKATAGKTPQNKARRGRGPAVHEALQRIPSQRRAIAVRNVWHAPGDSLFDCGPLDDKRPCIRQLESSSSDDDTMPDFEAGCGAACVEESAAESRGARLALRRAALRRHVAHAHLALRLAPDHRHHWALAATIKKQLNASGSSSRLPTQTVNHLLAMRGMPTLLSSQERRKLRESGWSGGAGVSAVEGAGSCSEERCPRASLPCARYCAAHVCRSPEQRLYAACAAVFAGGARCNQPVLPLNVQTPLCTEHAWKRDNYDKLSRDWRPKKTVRRSAGGTGRAKRRRRPPARRPPPSAQPSRPELNVCSNSSTYDSSEDTAMGTLSDSEYTVVASDSHELEVEVGHVPADDILDPAVLSQIPDEAFTEFFNQAEGSAAFAESSELAAALEAVLDERGLDERVLDERALDIADCVLSHSHSVNKVQVPASIPMEMSSSAPS